MNFERKESCRTNFERFCTTYFPNLFYTPFTAERRQAIAIIEQAVLRGGLFAKPMTRASGKTTLLIVAAIWTASYGHHPYVLMLTDNLDSATWMICNITDEAKDNNLLREDFPWSTGKPAYLFGTIVRGFGITSKIRGLSESSPSGIRVRPSLVLIDDPQNCNTAESPSQNEKREHILTHHIPALAGPGGKIAGVMLCTKQCDGDLADRMQHWTAYRHTESEADTPTIIDREPK